LVKDLESAHPRHHEIQQDQVHMILFELLQPALATVRQQYAVILRQNQPVRFANAQLVVNGKNGFHAIRSLPTPRCAPSRPAAGLRFGAQATAARTRRLCWSSYGAPISPRAAP